MSPSVEVFVEVLDRPTQSWTVPEAFQRPAPTRSAAVTPANSPAQIAQPRPPATSSALGFPRPASDLSAIRNTGISNRSYHSAAYRAGQIARGGVEIGKGIGKGIVLNQIEQALQGTMDAGFDNWLGEDRRDARFDKPAWDINARTNSRIYNEAYAAQERAIQNRNEIRDQIDQKAEQLSNEASKTWENARNAGKNAIDGIGQAARELWEDLKRELDDFEIPFPIPFPIPPPWNPLSPSEDKAREENPLPDPKPSPDPNITLDDGPPAEDDPLIPDPDSPPEDLPPEKEVEVEEEDEDPNSEDESNGPSCEGWAKIRVDRLLVVNKRYTPRIGPDAGKSVSYTSTSQWSQFYWIRGMNSNKKKTITYRYSGKVLSPPYSWSRKGVIKGIRASEYLPISSWLADSMIRIGHSKSTNNQLDPDRNGYFWDPYAVSPRHGYYASTQAYFNTADNPGWVDDYKETTHQTAVIVMLFCEAEQAGRRKEIEIRNRDNMANGCSCDSIRAMLKSLQQTLSIPIVSCKLNPETNKWEPKVEQKTIQIFTLDEKTALGMAELYKQQAEIAVAQCEAKNGADINAALGFPVTVPKYLNNGRDDEEEVINLVELYRNWIQIFDGLMGEFPVKMEVTTDENQEHPIELPTVADALGDLFSLAVPIFYDADNNFSLATKMAGEQIKANNTAWQTYYLLYSISEQLGFDLKKKPEKLSYPIDPRFPDDWAQFNKEWIPVDNNVEKFENDDKQTLKGILLELAQAIGPMKAALIENVKPDDLFDRIKKLNEIIQVGRSLGLGETLSQLRDSDWQAILQQLSRPGSPNSPEIKVEDKPPN